MQPTIPHALALSCFYMSLGALALTSCTKETGVAYNANGSPVAEVTVEAAGVSTGAAADPDASAPVDPFEAPVTADGWGMLKIGMTYSEAMAVFGVGPGSGIADADDCKIITPRGAPDGLQFMVEKGVVSRVSLSGSSPLRTDRGFGLGDKSDDILRAYGARAVKSRHKYAPAPSLYIDVWKGDPLKTSYVKDPAARGVRYEVGANRKVVSIHAGGPSIQYVEGCA